MTPTPAITPSPRDLNPAAADAFRILEERLAMPAESESRETLAELLAEGFQEFGSSGAVFGADAMMIMGFDSKKRAYRLQGLFRI
jgi:hypothetical protein